VLLVPGISISLGLSVLVLVATEAAISMDSVRVMKKESNYCPAVTARVQMIKTMMRV
jgi:hypothetical protein